jgi:CRISPR-associated protein Csm3
MMSPTINLYGRVLISGYIRAITGLHIGKGKEGVMIGGVDNPVMRDVLTNAPYIPGSSLKGKLRSLAEKSDPTRQPNKSVGRDVYIHICDSPTCPICCLYGIPGQQRATAPTRLTVRDAFMTAESKERLNNADTDLPFTEVKYEASIDRVTSQANPRPLERVPADTLFGSFEMVLSIYQPKDYELLRHLFTTMQLLEDDSLGGSGSRGSGKVSFETLSVVVKSVEEYGKSDPALFTATATDLTDLLAKLDTILPEVKKLVAKEPQP